jgi:hypothetical protein
VYISLCQDSISSFTAAAAAAAAATTVTATSPGLQGYTLLMLLIDSPIFKQINRCMKLSAACCKRTMQQVLSRLQLLFTLRHHASQQQNRQQHEAVEPSVPESVILQICHNTTPASASTSTTDTASAACGTSVFSTPPASCVIYNPSTACSDPVPAAVAAAKGSVVLDDLEPNAASAAAADDNASPGKDAAATAAAAVDPSRVTTPFPMRSVVTGGAWLIMSLWVAQVRHTFGLCIRHAKWPEQLCVPQGTSVPHVEHAMCCDSGCV